MIEHATVHERGERAIEATLRHAPTWAVASVNRARQRAGLPAITSTIDRDDHGGGGRLGVWWDPDSPHRPRGGGLAVATRAAGTPATIDRVLIVAAYGDAAVGRQYRETIALRAFGPAEQLNREIGWGIVAPCHDGNYIAFGGRPGLRAHDTDVGLVLEWTVDPTRAAHAQAIRMIEAGAGASVAMKVQERGRLDLPEPIEVVRRARLLHVALTHRPAYAGAVAMIFRDCPWGDFRLLREQLAAVARRARDRARVTRGW
jgi:hypothetical protein